MQVASLDDLQSPATGIGDDLGHLRLLIAGISENTLDKGEQPPRPAEQVAGAIAVLHIGGLNADAQQEAERIDQDMALAPGDFLARVIPLRVKRRAPFCAALPLWLSMIAADGLVSRPACSRAAT